MAPVGREQIEHSRPVMGVPAGADDFGRFVEGNEALGLCLNRLASQCDFVFGGIDLGAKQPNHLAVDGDFPGENQLLAFAARSYPGL